MTKTEKAGLQRELDRVTAKIDRYDLRIDRAIDSGNAEKAAKYMAAREELLKVFEGYCMAIDAMGLKREFTTDGYGTRIV